MLDPSRPEYPRGLGPRDSGLCFKFKQQVLVPARTFSNELLFSPETRSTNYGGISETVNQTNKFPLPCSCVAVFVVGVVVVLKLCADLSSVPVCRPVSSWIGKTTVKMYIGIVK